MRDLQGRLMFVDHGRQFEKDFANGKPMQISKNGSDIKIR